MSTSQTGINHTNRGFSLLETLVVLAILGVLAATAVVASAQISTGARLRDAAMQLETDVNDMRLNSILLGKTTSIKLIGSNQYLMLPSNIQRELPADFAIAFKQESPVLARPASTMAVSFYPGGVSGSGRFTITAGASTRSVEINWPTGSAHYIQ